MLAKRMLNENFCYVISVDSPSPPRQINELNTEKEVSGKKKLI